MEDINKLLDKVPERFSEEAFLNNKGLSNEVGIHVFCYDPKDELTVRAFFEKLKERKNEPYRIIECDLYKIFLEICKEKRILDRIDTMESTKGSEFLLNQLQKIIPAESYVAKMNYEDKHPGRDILLITGVGKVYPFMRSHKIFDNIQHIFWNIPVVMLYPGEFSGQDLVLFNKIDDGNYYRAFNLL